MSHCTAASPPNPANEPSARFFGSIGLKPGARVLDVGCGNGDLSRLIAALVGADGEVVAIDRSEQALAAARAVAAGGSAAPIVYRAVDLAAPLPDLGTFDAIVGRRVLMYLPDAADTLKQLAALARPGAILAFQEHARTGLPAGSGDLPLHRQLYDWNWRTVAAEGGDTGLALRLGEMLQQLGATIEQARGEAILLHPGQPSFLPLLTQMMLPRMVEQGIATAGQVDPETLAQRLADEHRAAGGAIVWDIAFLVAGRIRSGPL
ncbi:methyltransferase domain-containing protein [Sphingomonas jatrophae]|uniref:Methyltransferase domain-containing protein n=1 Tax=Sphingomonas jatrophae TaxID=1166337 RepID=A0A1I6M7N1_9SPHN|nr:methyltransferase domain-containing protein [Sphingomonas jatrophae]SFS11755.1 Methyltransferase domain-containing protein [Sphingomonas jatrophae]